MGDEPSSFDASVRRPLLERFALVRLILAAANLGVIALDVTVPSAKSGQSLALALAIAVPFLFYSAVAYYLLRRLSAPSDNFGRAVSFADLVFAAALIAATGGYLSPFNLWIVFVVLETAATSSPGFVAGVAGTGFVFHLLMAFIPQPLPPPLATLMVRAGYLIGFAAIAGAIGNLLASKSAELFTLERISEGLSRAESLNDVERELEAHLCPLGITAVAVADGEDGSTDQHITFGGPPAILALHRRLLSEVEVRAVAAVRRIRLRDDARRRLALEERLSVFDTLHDTILQNLAAITMRAEVAIQEVTGGNAGAAVAEVVRMSDIARSSGSTLRVLIEEEVRARNIRPLDVLLRSRWGPGARAAIEEAAELTADQIRVAELMIREGTNNARVHGRASGVLLTIRREGAQYVCELEDNGAGPEDDWRPGYGLTRLSQAAAEAGGTLALEATGGGARLIIRFENPDV